MKNKSILQSLRFLTLLWLMVLGIGNAWGETTPTVLFHETFGDNSGSARDWNDSCSVKSGVSAVYSGITSYTVSNVKQGKNTTGSTKSGLNQSSAGTDAYIIIGPLNVASYTSLALTYQWKAASIKGTYSTKLYYATSSEGGYTEVTGSGNGATSFVTRSYSLPDAAQVDTLYLKIVWNTSNTQAIIDEVELTGTASGPQTLNVPNNLSANDITSNSATLSWTEVENASSYTVKIGDTEHTGINTNSYSATGLTASTEYTWTVKAIGDGTNYTSSDYATEVNFTTSDPTKTLQSIAVSGTPTKTKYILGDHFETAGLVVTGTYSDNSTAPITEGLEWIIDPDPLTAGTTSVDVMASVGSVVSDVYEVTGISVKQNSSITIDNMDIAIGEDKAITATTTPTDAILSYTITDGTDFISLQNGVVTGVSVGTSTIKASYAGNDEYYPTTQTFTVTVTSAPLTKYKITLTQPEKATIAATPATAAEGDVVTLSYSNVADHYHFVSWTVKYGETQVDVTDNYFIMPAGEVTVSATFEEDEHHNVIWSSNRDTTSVKYYKGQSITFPSSVTNVPINKVFMYWTDNEITSATSDAPTKVSSKEMGNEDLTYYAVFATKGKSAESMSASDTWNFSNTQDTWTSSNCETYYSYPYGMKKVNASISNKNRFFGKME